MDGKVIIQANVNWHGPGAGLWHKGELLLSSQALKVKDDTGGVVCNIPLSELRAETISARDGMYLYQDKTRYWIRFRPSGLPTIFKTNTFYNQLEAKLRELGVADVSSAAPWTESSRIVQSAIVGLLVIGLLLYLVRLFST